MVRAAVGDLQRAGVPRSLAEIRARVRLPLRIAVGLATALYLGILVGGWIAFARAGDPGISELRASPYVPGGQRIVSLQPWGAAFRAGVYPDDVVIDLDGVPIVDALSPTPPAYDLAVGDVAVLRVARAPIEEARAVENVAVVLQSRIERLDLLVEVVALTLLATLFFALGLVVVLARPSDAAARLFFMAAGGIGVSQAGAIWQYGLHESWAGDLEGWPFRFAVAATLHLFLAFPTPHPALTWLRSLGPEPARQARLGTAVLYLVPLGVRVLLDHGPVGSSSWWLPFLAFQLVLAVLALVRNFWHERTPTVHAQLLWMTWGMGIGVIAFILWAIVGIMPRTIMLLLVACVPVAMGLAVLRHRLFEIDVIINRTLVYGVITGLLGFTYFGSVYVLQVALRLVTDQQSDLAIVLSTIAVAALFQPLRRLVQATIDRRYYRRHYDAVKILTAFGATIRDEVDLNHLARQLCDVVDETMQPESVWLWLRDPVAPELSGPFAAIPGDLAGEAVSYGKPDRGSRLPQTVTTAG